MNTLNPAYKNIELEYALVKSGSKLLFLPGEESAQNSINDFWGVLRSINLDATALRSVVSLDTKIQRPLNGSIRLAELGDLLKSDGKANDFDNVNADDPAIIMFTSGNFSDDHFIMIGAKTKTVPIIEVFFCDSRHHRPAEGSPPVAQQPDEQRLPDRPSARPDAGPGTKQGLHTGAALSHLRTRLR